MLLIAANSAVNGFPRLLYFMARDDYAPRALLHLGDRLAFSAGIVVLAVPAAVIYAAFGGRTAPLIPLFTAGAWAVVILVPLIVGVCLHVHAHYARAREALAPQASQAFTTGEPLSGLAMPPPADSLERQDVPAQIRHLAVVPVAALDLAGLRALAYAASLGIPVLAVHVCPGRQEDERFRRYWRVWGAHLPLQVLVSPYRATIAPLANYIEALHHQRPDVTLTVVVPEVVPGRRWQRLLHHRTASRLRRTLIRYPGIIIARVPFHLTR